MTEASVEYGNALRALGRLNEALSHFALIRSALIGELALRAQRWQGVTAFQLGHSDEGLVSVEQAWHGYLASGHERVAANVMQTLARMYQQVNQNGRATRLYQQALRQLPESPNPLPRLSALQGLLDLQILGGQLQDAEQTLDEARMLLGHTTSGRARGMLMGSEANLAWVAGQFSRYEALIRELWPLSIQVGDSQLRLWTGVRWADLQSQAGHHAAALETLAESGAEGGPADPAVYLLRGLLARRRGHLSEAADALSVAIQLYESRSQPIEVTRGRLHLAYVQYLNNQLSTAFATLAQALDGYLALSTKAGFRRELEEMPEFLTAAALEPTLAPLLPDHSQSAQAVLHLTTLGRSEVRWEGRRLEGLKARHLAVLVYLLLRPGQSRARIETDLYPDVLPERARNQVNSILQDLRTTFGPDFLILTGPYRAPTYTINEGMPVSLDLTAVLRTAPHASIENILTLYKGEFLPDLQGGSWIESRRIEARESFRSAMSFAMRAAQAKLDWERVRLLAEQWIQRDEEDRWPYEMALKAAQALQQPALIAQAEAALKTFDT
ncbi:hypothetical protein GO986_09160 [Deinococcus sp. HMF7620]|uniref:SARP family transcriptional regulator n=2 Tax=Deinococcus arboris TaxID=2682977 RepID=A0A7C9HRL6_9DEIO|nr:hypothetical protein [Deinococcus arboris]